MSPAAEFDRNRLIAYGLGALFVVAALTQAKVQVLDRGETLERARKRQRFTLTRTEYARRGAIMSADGKPLAQDEDAYQLGITFARVPRSEAFFMDLARASGIPASEFEQLALRGATSQVWPKAITPEEARAIADVKTEWRADGVSLARASKRDYRLGEAASAVVGAIRDGAPPTGLEGALAVDLAGKNGLTVGLTDRAGAFLPMRIDQSSSAKHDGLDVLTTIESSLQEVAAAAIREAVEANKADNGVAIVMDPSTGDVLAMANWPSFDPSPKANVARGDQPVSDLNPVVKERFEPGSTFKILTLARALDRGKVTATTTIYCPGQISIGKKVIHCDNHHGNRAHGSVTPEMAIVKSCNISAANWALRVGYGDFVDYIKSLGLLRPTGIGLRGEVKGQFREDEPAKQLQLATVGFGQSIATTPLALCSAFSMLGNGGMRMQPRLIQKVGSRVNAVREAGRAVKQETAARLMSYMEAVIESDAGTGHALRIPGFRLAGKTGTAQRINRNDGGGYVSNFVGFVPAQQPRAVVLVMVNHPKAGQYYGASVAGPVFVKIAKGVLARYQIAPDSDATKDAQAKRTPVIVRPERRQAGPELEVTVRA
ncbi:MAG: penicillin-binding protein 2 [Fimbriimonas ginsengisoli]|uniref:Penicillin-binding protein 2 n=1 Tax=Fimbriimonas ginsengisoli TaxID=1005039 RepID=A0A931PUB5_FIMGI|nr:penicillin-binding protein 2 [Fimbriimonas ginsengisoli]